MAGALAVAGFALAAGSSTATVSFSPNNPGATFTSGRFFFGTQTQYTALTRTTRIRLALDDDFQFNPNSFPKCDPADISGDMTIQEAMQACGPPAGAANNAWLYPARLGAPNGTALLSLGPETLTACVFAFNGSGTASEVLLFIRVQLEGTGPIDCTAPETNTAGQTSFLMRGDLKANPAIGGDYTDPDNCSAPDPRRGCQIDFNEVSDGPIRLVHLSTQIGRLNYVRARCVDPPAGNRQWNLQAIFTATNPTGPPRTQTVTDSQTCT
jgi:hypothetical protein